MGELPVGWVNTRLGEIVEYAETIKKEPSGIKENEWVLELEDIEKKSSKLLKRLSYSDRKSKSTKNRFLTGDVLYGKLRPYLDKIIIADQDGYCSTEIIPITPNSFLDGRYLFYSLKRKEFLDYVDKISHGLNMPRLGTKQGKLAPFILSPLNEQIRIANKLDSLLAKVEAAQIRLDKIPTLLKRFRQAVLAAATSGELTEQWRDKKNIKWNNKTDNIGNLGKVLGGLTKNPKRNAFPFMKQYLRVANVYENELRLDDVQNIGIQEKELERVLLQKNDILVVEGNGSIDQIGRVAMWNNEIAECVHQNHLIKIRSNIDKIFPKFLLYYLMSPPGKKEIVARATSGAGLYTLSISKISSINVPLVVLAEQKQIVQQVESLFTLADKVEKQYQQARLRTDKLTQSLLAKAFKGELVPQDPSDEPAEKLLARIQAEREKQKPVKKVRKNRLKKQA